MRFRLSRSALLYYDSIGLLCPSLRTESGYRLYSESDAERLANILAFRQAGVSLEEIRLLLSQQETEYSRILVERFNRINEEIRSLKEQQASIADMLKNSALLERSPQINRNTWNALMHSTGFDDKTTRDWHAAFERISPAEHAVFLETLGFFPDEIRSIQEWSRRKND